MEEYQDTQVSAEQEGVVGSPADDQEAPEQEGGKEQRDAGAAAQGKDDRENNRMAAARRSGAREGYSKARKEADEQIAAFGRTDPRTGKPIRNMDDILAFLQGQEDAEIAAEASKTKRSEADIRREREARKLGERELEKQRKEEEQNQFYRTDYADFIDVYGKETWERIKKDADFEEYAEGKIGRKSLVDIYQGYLRLTGKAERTGREKRESKAERSTGSGSGGAGDGGLTAAQQAELNAWNQRYPEKKMTAKEWRSR